MRKPATKNIMKLHSDLVESSKEDIYRDNPSDDVLNKRKMKQKRRAKQLRDLEQKYFLTKEKKVTPPKSNKLANMSKEKCIDKFTKLKRMKKQIEEDMFRVDVNPLDDNYSYLYHTIETEKLNAADMYGVIKALQTHLQREHEKTINKKKENVTEIFENSGGISQYNALKNYLTDMGVNVHEIN